MRRTWYFLPDEALLGFAASVGMRMMDCVTEQEMVDENHMARRWATVRGHLLEAKYDGLTEEELGWLAEGMLRKVIQETVWGHEAMVKAQVHLYGDSAVSIAYLVELFE